MNSNWKKVVFDIEANGLADADIVWCICLLDAETEETKSFIGDSIPEALGILQEADLVIGHNIVGYDIPTLEKIYPGFTIDPAKVFDTLIAMRLMKPDMPGGHSLALWGKRLGNYKTDFRQVCIEGGYIEAGAPKGSEFLQFCPEMPAYCKQDCRVTQHVLRCICAVMVKEGWAKSLAEFRKSMPCRLEHEAQRILSAQERHGVVFDVALGEKFVRRACLVVSMIDKKLEKVLPAKETTKEYKKPLLNNGEFSRAVSNALNAGWKFQEGTDYKVMYRRDPVKLSSEKQIKEALLALGWRPTEYTDKGSPRLTEDSLVSWDDELGPLLAKRMMYRHRIGLVQGILDKVREDGRVGAGGIAQGAVTGRVAHRVVANLPRVSTIHGATIRRMFRAPEGKVLVGCDASGIELRCLAHYINREEFSNIILEGDIHQVVADALGVHRGSTSKTFCVPMDTQALTREGWKTYDQLSIGDTVLTYNEDRGIKQWQPITDLYKFDAAPIIEMHHGHSFKFRSTPDHRWFVRQRSARHIEGKLTKVDDTYGGRYLNPEVRTTSEINTESNIVVNAPMEYDSGRMDLSLGIKKYGTDWSKIVCQMGTDQRLAFLNGFLIADGHMNLKSTRWNFTQVDNEHFEAALTACAIEHDGFLHVQKRKLEHEGRKQMKAVHLNAKGHVTGQRLVKTELPPEPVWCPRTENGSWVARQGDVITITGNSYATLYGSGDEKLGKILHSDKDAPTGNPKGWLPIPEHGQHGRMLWKKALPGSEALTEKLAVYVDQGFIPGIDGRNIPIRSEHAALNTLLQSCGALIMKAASLKAVQVLKGVEGAAQVIHYHDEMQWECYEADAEYVGRVLQKSIQWAGELFKLNIELAGEYKIGENWKHTH